MIPGLQGLLNLGGGLHEAGGHLTKTKSVGINRTAGSGTNDALCIERPPLNFKWLILLATTGSVSWTMSLYQPSLPHSTYHCSQHKFPHESESAGAENMRKSYCRMEIRLYLALMPCSRTAYVCNINDTICIHPCFMYDFVLCNIHTIPLACFCPF